MDTVEVAPPHFGQLGAPLRTRRSTIRSWGNAASSKSPACYANGLTNAFSCMTPRAASAAFVASRGAWAAIPHCPTTPPTSPCRVRPGSSATTVLSWYSRKPTALSWSLRVATCPRWQLRSPADRRLLAPLQAPPHADARMAHQERLLLTRHPQQVRAR